MLETIVYLSSAAADFDEDEIEPILEKARDRNAENGLTGVLLYAKGSFIQVLEGETAAIDETMARIRSDARHGEIEEIFRGPIEAQTFLGWHLGFRNASLVLGDDSMALTPKSLKQIQSPGVGRQVAALMRQFYQSACCHEAA